MNSTLLLLPFSAPYPPSYKDDALRSEYKRLKVLLFDAIQDPALMRTKLTDVFPALFRLRVKQMARRSEGKSVPAMGAIEQYYSNISQTGNSKGLSALALSVEFSYRIYSKNVAGFEDEEQEEGYEIFLKFLGSLEFREFSILMAVLLPAGINVVTVFKDLMLIELGVILLDELTHFKVDVKESSLDEMAIIVNEATREFGVLSKQLGFSKKRGAGRPLEYLPVSDEEIQNQMIWAEAGVEDFANTLDQ